MTKVLSVNLEHSSFKTRFNKSKIFWLVHTYCCLIAVSMFWCVTQGLRGCAGEGAAGPVEPPPKRKELML